MLTKDTRRCQQSIDAKEELQEHDSPNFGVHGEYCSSESEIIAVHEWMLPALELENDGDKSRQKGCQTLVRLAVSEPDEGLGNHHVSIGVEYRGPGRHAPEPPPTATSLPLSISSSWQIYEKHLKAFNAALLCICKRPGETATSGRRPRRCVRWSILTMRSTNASADAAHGLADPRMERPSQTVPCIIDLRSLVSTWMATSITSSKRIRHCWRAGQ